MTKNPAIKPDEWQDIHDAYALVREALGSGPEDVNVTRLISAMAHNYTLHERMALRIARRMSRT